MNREPSIQLQIYDNYNGSIEQIASVDYLNSPLKDDEEDYDFDDSKYDYQTLLNQSQGNYENYLQDESEHPIFKNPQILLENYFSFRNIKKAPDYSIDCTIDLESYSPNLIEEVKITDFTLFAQSVVKQKNSIIGIFNKPIKFHYDQKIDLNNCVLTLGNESNDKIKTILTHLLSYTKEIESNAQPIFHIQKIIDIVFHENSLIKDEIFIQVVKQIIDNNSISVMFYYQFMAVYCTAFSPSTMFFKPLLNFFYHQKNRTVSDIYKSYCKFIFNRICRTYFTKTTMYLNEKEIRQIINLKPIIFAISIYINNYLFLEMDTQQNCGQILDQICEQLQLSQRDNLYLCLIKTTNIIEEIYLRAEEKLFSILRNHISTYQKLTDDLNKAPKFKLIIKCYKIMSIYQDLESFNIAYMVSLQDYLSEQFVMTDGEIIEICALKLAADIGCNLPLNKIRIDINEFVPNSRKSFGTMSEVLMEIYKMYMSLNIQNKRQARNRILEILSKQPRFLSMSFEVSFNLNGNLSRKVKCHIGSDSIKLCLEPRAIYFQLEYDLINELDLANNKCIHFIANEAILYLYFDNHKECLLAYELVQKYMRSLLYNNFQYNSY